MDRGAAVKLKPFQTPAPHITRADRPAAELEAELAGDMKALIVRQSFQAVVASLDPFARMACEHPEACSCAADYPDFHPGGGA